MSVSVRVSVEQRRGCGYRQEGGLYLVGPALAAPCGALPVELEVCPTCGAGVKPSRGWTWVDPHPLLKQAVQLCPGHHGVTRCPVCDVPRIALEPHAGLLWIGAEHYALPSHFELEASRLGVSRRIPAVPNGFELGRTWVLLAHRRAWSSRDGGGTPGIFGAFCPTGLEQVVSPEGAQDAEAMQKLRNRGIEPVVVVRA